MGDEAGVMTHEITTEEINAAWKYATYHNRYVDFKILGIFKIHRCEGCGGCGIYTEDNDDGSHTHTWPCNRCNGHGWTKAREAS